MSGVVVQPVLLVVIVLGAVALGLLSGAARRAQLTRQSRPLLPAEDRPPAGLGRLVPVGVQVEDECRRGLVALERWLLAHRQAGRGGA